MGNAVSTDHTALEQFFILNQIPAASCAKIIKYYTRMMAGEIEPFAPDQLPGHLHDDFMRIVRQAIYERRSEGQIFNSKKAYLP